MRTLRPLLTGTIVLAVASLPLSAAAQDDDEVKPIGNLVYATGKPPAEATELTLFLLQPAAGSEDAPMVIDVSGSAVDARELAERGVSVFLVFYPDRWPEVQADADPEALRAMAEAMACAVRFARGSEYGSETAPLVLTGWSRYAGPPSHVALAGESFDQVWKEYAESGGAPPAQYDCTVTEASTRVDGLVGVGGTYDTYVGYEGLLGRGFLLEHEPELWEMLWGTVGLHPELRVRLLHGDSDTTIPLEVSAGFADVLAEAGYDVELVEFAGGHGVPPDSDLVNETVLELLAS